MNGARALASTEIRSFGGAGGRRRLVYNALCDEQVNGVCGSDTGCGTDRPWGAATSWQTPRRYELGFRIEF